MPLVTIKLLLFFCTILTILVQTLFVEQYILPYNTFLLQNIYSSTTFFRFLKKLYYKQLMQTYTFILHKMLPTPFTLTTPQHRNIRLLTQDVKPFLKNVIFNYTKTLPLNEKPILYIQFC